MDALVSDGILGMTSNPTIFQAAITGGDAYDEQLREVLEHKTDPKQVFLALAGEDIREACDKLAGVFERGDSTRDDRWRRSLSRAWTARPIGAWTRLAVRTS